MKPGPAVSNDAQNSSSLKDSRAGRGWTLRQRLLLIITIALLPIAFVSVLEGVERVRRDAADVRERLIQSARTASEDDQSLLNSGEQILRAVGSLKDVRDITEACDADLADAMIGVDYFNNLSRIDDRGTVVCSALPLVKGVNIADTTQFQQGKRSSAMLVSAQTISRATGQPVIAAQVALRKADGTFDGAVAISLDVRWFDYLLHNHPLPPGAVVSVFDRDGVILASNDRKVAPAVARAALAAGAPGGVSLDAQDAAGLNWRFGTATLPGGNLFVAYAERQDRLFGPTYLHVAIDFLLPIFMILIAWVAIWFATDQQVTQWISYLRRIAVAYRSGHYTIRPDLADAPAEFRLLGDAMSEMAEGIQDRDRRLREAVNVKTTMIREIHHRVKNNLQIVMSLLSIQANQVRDPVSREALMQAQTRINALALVHRILNELEDQSTLDLKQLLEELCRQIAEGMGAADHIRIELDVPHLVVQSGVAVALALFTVEALTNIFKHAFPSEAKGVIRVEMTRDRPGLLRLAIIDNGIGFTMDDAGKSVGSRLIRTFGAQLGGVSSVRSEAGKGTVVDLIFPEPGVKE
jgi:two-component sensor histidine kinase